MIVGTAGHIDHGKSTLVLALTGVDTDRLPDEKRRGISIDLGYAFLDTPDGERIGFIDVPGHERLVHTMLAGAGGIEFALLVVAADDGVMPQTREHLAVLSLLGLSRGAVAITKIDRVEAARPAEVAREVAALIAATPLAGAPILRVSAARGDGVAELAALLFDAAGGTQRLRDDGAEFRLAVDRAFSLEGVGTVATGTARSGIVRPGDELVLLPLGRTVRVRSVHAQDRKVSQAAAGQRCALNLVGVAREEVARGHWLTAPQAALVTDRIDAALEVWHAEPGPLRSGTHVHVHLGTAALQGSVAVLDGDAILPGHRARVQIVLRSTGAAWHGDRVVLRDASASRTIAGGTVLDPCAPARYRRAAQRLAQLDALALADARQRASALLDAAPHGVDWRRFGAAQGRAVPVPAAALVGGDVALGPAHVAAARTALLDALAAFHERQAHEFGLELSRLRRLALPRLPDPVFRKLLSRLRDEGLVVIRGARVQLPAHAIRLSSDERRIRERVGPLLQRAGFAGAWVRDLAREAGEPETQLRATLSRLAQAGELHQIVRDLFASQAAVRELAAIARELSERDEGAIRAARFRDAAGLGRNRTIQVLEYFDRVGLLRRVGDVHKLRGDSSLFVDAADDASEN